MGDIGIERREVEFEPVPQVPPGAPVPAPAPEPAQPAQPVPG